MALGKSKGHFLTFLCFCRTIISDKNILFMNSNCTYKQCNDKDDDSPSTTPFTNGRQKESDAKASPVFYPPYKGASFNAEGRANSSILLYSLKLSGSLFFSLCVLSLSTNCKFLFYNFLCTNLSIFNNNSDYLSIMFSSWYQMP